ncbi:MAG: hypothetical protein LIO93_09715 [Bacteroidales bacterium]|nr:hypothetical protein [Bacteroidales bacterium]
MIKYISIFLIALFAGVHTAWGTDKDSIAKDTVFAGSLEFDQEKYNNFKSQKKFDYYQQFKEDDSRWLNDLERKLYRWLKEHFSPNLTKKQFDNVLLFGAILFLVLLVVILYIYKPSLFYLERKKKLDYRIEDEEIENLNLDKLISQALENEEYAKAVRWKYLKVLQALNEKELISFDPNKTVNEYVYEITRNDLRADFKELSRRFAYYRYGNGEASLVVFNEFDELSTKFLNRFYN